MGKKIDNFSFYFSREHRVAFWSSLPVLNSISELKIPQQEGVMCCLFGGIARKDAGRTNILLSLRSPVVGRAVFPNAGGNLDWAALETSRTSLTDSKLWLNLSWWHFPGTSGQEEGACSSSWSSDPSSHEQKPHLLLSGKLHVYISVFVRCEPAFQCTLGPIPRTVDPTSVTDSWCNSPRTRDAFNPLDLSTSTSRSLSFIL